MLRYILIYLLVINLVSFIVMYIDKQKAKREEYRISERTLFILALCFGAAGILGGMSAFRHKTLHRSFTVGIPIILLLQVILGYLLVVRVLLR